ncbi:MAG: hypothetical protein J7J93_02470 [Candidatus Aenigmarchaeota archaeon]|nr:hypothetical protein [Candidatus Aenigmarchaeota archaeon]
MLKKIIPIFIMFLLIPLATSVSITNCKSGDNDWECQQGEICTCYISGACTDGNLFVYKDTIGDLYCMPSIENGKAEIDLNNCNNPSGSIKVRADCDEGQSAVKTIEIVSESTTTTHVTTTTTTELKECPFDCCIGESQYEDKFCGSGYECVNNECVKTGKSSSKGLVIVGILIIIIVAVVAFFIIKKGSESKEDEFFRRFK